MIGGADSEATVVLKITHITGDQDTVEMFVQYQDPPYTGFQLLPPIPRYKTAAYTIKVPKGMRIQVGGGTNGLRVEKVTPSGAIEDYNGDHYLHGHFRILDSCVVEGDVDTY